MQEFSTLQFVDHLVVLGFHHVFDSFPRIAFAEEMAVRDAPGQENLTTVINKCLHRRIILALVLRLDMKDFISILNISVKSDYHEQIII